MGRARRAISGDGSVYPRKDGRYAGSFKAENGKRVYVYGKTQHEALEKLRKKQQEDGAGTLVTAPTQSLKSYLQDWMVIQQTLLKPGTAETYNLYIEYYILPHLGHLKLKEVGPEKVQVFLAKLLQKLAPATVRQVHIILSAAFTDALEWKKIAINPMAVVKPPRDERREIAVLTAEQAQQLLTAACGKPLEAMLTVALATGMRRGELIGLKWDDINLEKGILQVRRTVSYLKKDGRKAHVETKPKTRSSARTISLPRIAIEALRRHHTKQLEQRRKAGAKWEERGLVFPTKTGGYYSPPGIIYQFRQTLQVAELPRIRFHDLRHTCATLLLQRGVHVKVVSELLGHSSITITLSIYAHVLPTMQQAAASEMDKLFTN